MHVWGHAHVLQHMTEYAGICFGRCVVVKKNSLIFKAYVETFMYDLKKKLVLFRFEEFHFEEY